MKRPFLFILCCLTLGAPALHATDYDNLLFFNGIGTAMPAGGNSNTVGIEQQVNEMYQRYYTSKAASSSATVYDLKNNQPKVIVGQSQGGVRALGYASMYPSTTAAVVTIGAPVKGHPMLLNLQTTKNAVSSACQTIYAGATAALDALGPHILDLTSLAARILGPTLVDQIANAMLVFKINDDVNLKAILTMAANPSTTAYPGIKDLSPTSAFFQKYINPSVSYKFVRVQRGVTEGPRVIEGESIDGSAKNALSQIAGTVETPQYNYYMVPASAASVKKIPDNIYLSFIRGIQNDPLTFLDSSSEVAVRLNMTIYKNVTSMAASVETGQAHENDILKIAAALSLNIPLALVCASMADTCRANARCCQNGHDWVANYVKNIGLILGDTSNDSFIPCSSQSWDLSVLGGKTFGPSLVRDFLDNHIQEMSDPKIFGQNGGMHSGAADHDGYLAQVLNYIKHDCMQKTQKAANEDGDFTSLAIDGGP